MSEAPIPSPQPSPEPQASKYRRGSACGCPRCRCGGLMGPVILITLGVLFLLPQMIHRVDFGDLWPILLIVIGVMKLLESTASVEGHQR